MREMKHGTTREGVEVVRGPRSRVSVLLTLVVAVGLIGFLAGGSIVRSATQTNATVSLHRTRLGSILVTSRGHTLYLFARDRRGGQTNGEGSLLFGARWWAVSARGTAVVKAPTTTTSTTTTTPTTTSSCL